MISSDAAFFCLTVILTVFHADCLGSGNQLVNARLGDLQLCGDFPDGIPLQCLHLECSRNAGILGIHHCLNALILQFCLDLLVHRNATYRFVPCIDKAIPADNGSLLLVFVGAGCTGNGVRALDECFSLAGDHTSGTGITA